jgi:hypothetical protein
LLLGLLARVRLLSLFVFMPPSIPQLGVIRIGS